MAEPMERRSNILLVRDGRIRDCIRRVGPDENRVRVSLPGYPYVPPPPQLSKILLNELPFPFLEHALDPEPVNAAWRVLTDKLLAFSPLLPKETWDGSVGIANVKASDPS